MHIVQINLVKGFHPVCGLFEVSKLISSEAITCSGLFESTNYSGCARYSRKIRYVEIFIIDKKISVAHEARRILSKTII